MTRRTPQELVVAALRSDARLQGVHPVVQPQSAATAFPAAVYYTVGGEEARTLAGRARTVTQSIRVDIRAKKYMDAEKILNDVVAVLRRGVRHNVDDPGSSVEPTRLAGSGPRLDDYDQAAAVYRVITTLEIRT